MASLICIRHGQSLWNKENRFTGWVDVDLSEQGQEEALKAAKILSTNNITPNLLFTSQLKRAIQTADIISKSLNLSNIETFRSWRLNERHYGDLQGKNKKETAEIHGEDQVKIWRRSYSTPPPLTPESTPIPSNWNETDVPEVRGESLKNTVDRVIPYWENEIFPKLKSGRDILIAAHGNSLRGLLKHLFAISDNEIVKLEIATGMPIQCNFDDHFNFSEFKILE